MAIFKKVFLSGDTAAPWSFTVPSDKKILITNINAHAASVSPVSTAASIGVTYDVFDPSVAPTGNAYVINGDDLDATSYIGPGATIYAQTTFKVVVGYIEFDN